MKEMNDIIFQFNSLSVYSLSLLVVLSYLWGAFVYYKKGIQAHFEEYHLLDSIILMGFWGSIMARLFYVFSALNVFLGHWQRILILGSYPGMNRWGAFVGVLLGLLLVLRKTKQKLFDWLDLVTLGITAGLSVFFAGLVAITKNYLIIPVALLALFGFIMFWRLENNYRKMDWYKNKKASAKSGFVSGVSASLWGLLFFIECLALKRLTLINILWSVMLFVAGFVLVYIRSGRTLREDIKSISKYGRSKR